MPEQINRVLNENDVSFLLDLTHAKITAVYKEYREKVMKWLFIL